MHYNNLTPAEAERLAILAEECGEVIQAVGKILRHGWGGQVDNRTNLEKEIGDIVYITDLMSRHNDIYIPRVGSYASEKAVRIQQYLHHN